MMQENRKNLKFQLEKSKVLKLCILYNIVYQLFILHFYNLRNNQSIMVLPSKFGHLKNCCTKTFHTALFPIFAA